MPAEKVGQGVIRNLVIKGSKKVISGHACMCLFSSFATKHQPHQVSIQALVKYLSGWNASAFFFHIFHIEQMDQQ